MRKIVIILSVILSLVIAIAPAVFTETTCSVVEVEDFDDCKVVTVETDGNLYQFYVDADIDADLTNVITDITTAEGKVYSAKIKALMSAGVVDINKLAKEMHYI